MKINGEKKLKLNILMDVLCFEVLFFDGGWMLWINYSVCLVLMGYGIKY